jgi:ribose transport system ATP-binding protein
VHLELRRGEILGVAGLSGSGREDLCGAIVGATWGQCAIVDVEGGKELRRVTPASSRDLGVALVLPNRSAASAVSPFSMRENVTLPGLGRHSRLGFVRKGAERSLMSEWIDRLDIRPRDPEHLYALLSGGNQQKTVLAKWLAINPRALLLDDPTTGVDVGARSRIYDLITAQAADGLAVLVASSDLEDLTALCDRVIVLARGTVAEELVGDQLQEGVILDALNHVSVTGSIKG